MREVLAHIYEALEALVNYVFEGDAIVAITLILAAVLPFLIAAYKLTLTYP